MLAILISYKKEDRFFDSLSFRQMINKQKLVVNQALIMAGGVGSRLELGTKSHLLYKGKIILEYVIESCIKAGIENIVVVLVPKNLEDNIEKVKIERLNFLKKKYPQIKFVRGSNLSFRKTPNEVRRYLDEKQPFYFLCGQSPQSSSFLKQLATLYKPNSIVCSGYKTRHNDLVSMGKIKDNKIICFSNEKVSAPKIFKAKKNEVITHFPYIIDFNFYDKYLKMDGYKDIFEFCPDRLLRDGGEIYFSTNPVKLSEIDYADELIELYRSVDSLVKNIYQV